jgi:hypothetical protein
MPAMFKVFSGMFIDIKIVKKRKTLLGYMGFIQFLIFLLIGFVELPLTVFCGFIFLGQVCIVIMDTALESIVIQQGRVDPENG